MAAAVGSSAALVGTAPKTSTAAIAVTTNFHAPLMDPSRLPRNGGLLHGGPGRKAAHLSGKAGSVPAGRSRARWSRKRGQRHGEDGAHAGGAGERDPPTHPLDGELAEGESEPGVAARIVAGRSADAGEILE